MCCPTYRPSHSGARPRTHPLPEAFFAYAMIIRWHSGARPRTHPLPQGIFLLRDDYTLALEGSSADSPSPPRYFSLTQRLYIRTQGLEHELTLSPEAFSGYMTIIHWHSGARARTHPLPRGVLC